MKHPPKQCRDSVARDLLERWIDNGYEITTVTSNAMLAAAGS